MKKMVVSLSLMIGLAIGAVAQDVPLNHTVPWWSFRGHDIRGDGLTNDSSLYLGSKGSVYVGGVKQTVTQAGSISATTDANGLYTFYLASPITNVAWVVVTASTNVPNWTARVAGLATNGVTLLNRTNELTAATLTNRLYYIAGQN